MIEILSWLWQVIVWLAWLVWQVIVWLAWLVWQVIVWLAWLVWQVIVWLAWLVLDNWQFVLLFVLFTAVAFLARWLLRLWLVQAPSA